MIKIDSKKGIFEMQGDGSVIYEELSYALHIFYEGLEKEIGDEALDSMVKRAKISTSDLIKEALVSDDELVRKAASLLKDIRELRKLFEDRSGPSDKSDTDDSFSSMFGDLLDDDENP